MADVINEVLQNLPTARRVHDFGMELQSVELPLGIFDGGEVAAFSGPDNVETFRQRRHFVAMAVPNVELAA